MSDDAARFLADSPDRLALLERLREGAAGPARLADDLGCARRSIQRNLAAFAERGWVERADGYRLTTVGSIVATTHGEYLARLDRLETFAPLLRHLPRDDAPPPEALTDAKLVVAAPENPQGPVSAYVDHLKSFDGDRVRMCSPVLSRIFHEAHASLAVRGVHTELVLAESTADRARELNPLEFEAVLRVGVLDLYTRPSPIPFGLTLCGDQVLVAGYDDEGHLDACLASSSPALLDWAESRFEAYRADASKVEPSGGLPFGLDSR